MVGQTHYYYCLHAEYNYNKLLLIHIDKDMNRQTDTPISDSFSKTITFNDGRLVRSSRAVARPTIPPPTTATS